MRKIKIKKIQAREIINSAGIFSIETTITTSKGSFSASTPKGTSKGKHEVTEFVGGLNKATGVGFHSFAKHIASQTYKDSCLEWY